MKEEKRFLTAYTDINSSAVTKFVVRRIPDNLFKNGPFLNLSQKTKTVTKRDLITYSKLLFRKWNGRHKINFYLNKFLGILKNIRFYFGSLGDKRDKRRILALYCRRLFG